MLPRAVIRRSKGWPERFAVGRPDQLLKNTLQLARTSPSIMSGLHVAPNPGPPVGKSHDISFEKEKTLMRMITNEGGGMEAREGSMVNIHLTISQPSEDGDLVEIYRSKDTEPSGLKFQLGHSLYSEAVERTLIYCKPGAVLDSLCTDKDVAADTQLGIFARKIPDGAKRLWCAPNGPVGNAQEAIREPDMMGRKPEDVLPDWQPPQYVMLFHILLDAVHNEGGVPMYMDAFERIAWVNERKQWATELFKRGLWRRAMHGYKKAMLDLEVPVKWENDSLLLQRNQLRVALHLNCAACAAKLDYQRGYPMLQCPKYHYNVHRDAIFHTTRVLDADKHNIKALYRRAQVHLLIPAEHHINGLALAIEDLDHALEHDPQNDDVKKLLRRARERQKRDDSKAANMYTKMISAGVEV